MKPTSCEVLDEGLFEGGVLSEDAFGDVLVGGVSVGVELVVGDGVKPCKVGWKVGKGCRVVCVVGEWGGTGLLVVVWVVGVRAGGGA
eukprot:3725142-Prorocentrum_lima.AAC.1